MKIKISKSFIATIQNYILNTGEFSNVVITGIYFILLQEKCGSQLLDLGHLISSNLFMPKHTGMGVTNGSWKKKIKINSWIINVNF